MTTISEFLKELETQKNHNPGKSISYVETAIPLDDSLIVQPDTIGDLEIPEYRHSYLLDFLHIVYRRDESGKSRFLFELSNDIKWYDPRSVLINFVDSRIGYNFLKGVTERVPFAERAIKRGLDYLVVKYSPRVDISA